MEEGLQFYVWIHNIKFYVWYIFMILSWFSVVYIFTL